jgi:hypothetical protein
MSRYFFTVESCSLAFSPVYAHLLIHWAVGLGPAPHVPTGTRASDALWRTCLNPFPGRRGVSFGPTELPERAGVASTHSPDGFLLESKWVPAPRLAAGQLTS